MRPGLFFFALTVGVLVCLFAGIFYVDYRASGRETVAVPARPG